MFRNILVHIPSERPVRPVIDVAVALTIARRSHLDAVAIGYESKSAAGMIVEGGGAAVAAVMGAEQAALTMANVMEAGAKRRGIEPDATQVDALKKQIVDNFESQSSALVTSARLLDDGIIDPRDTRNVLGLTLSICREADARTLRPVQFGVARP